jgi:hypothetical protein
LAFPKNARMKRRLRWLLDRVLQWNKDQASGDERISSNIKNHRKTNPSTVYRK